MVLMDVYEAERVVRKGTTEETTRPPLGLSEKNNAVIRRPRTTRDVPSRYKSAISSSHSVTPPVVPKRFPSPNVARTTPTPSLANSKRSLSAERNRPSTPPSPPSPSTPAQDVPAQMHSDPRRVPGGRSEGLWPSSTMRSLCVSFQSDTFSVPVSKKEKPVTYASYDHTLRPSANVAHRKAETAVLQRNPTPERKRSPLRGRNASDQSENSKPTNNSHPRVVDQNRSSKIMGGKVSSSAINRTMVLTDKASKASSLPLLRRGVSPARRLALSNGIPSNLQKAQSDLARRVSLDTRGVEHDLFVIDDVSSQSCGMDKLLSSSISSSSDLSECTLSTPHTVRSQSLPIPGSSRPASPCKARFPSSSPSRGISPSRSRPSSQYPSVSSLGNRSSSTSSVLSFIADYRKGKKGANHIEDAHQLRLLYNRYQQWRFANARADAAFSIQMTTTETTLYNVWNTTSDLQYSVTIKRINLQQLREELKLQSVLDRQTEPGSLTQQAPPSSVLWLGPDNIHGFKFLTISVATTLDGLNKPPSTIAMAVGQFFNPDKARREFSQMSLLLSSFAQQHAKTFILQVLVSLQGLVLNSKPYFNEAGYDKQVGTAEGEKNSLAYNENTFLLSCKYMMYLLRSMFGMV